MASQGRDLGRETLPPNDGWASIGGGTTGGADATPDHMYTVTNRQELIAALNPGVYPPPSSTPSSTPKIIYVEGTIDVNVDDNNQPLACEDYCRDGYTLEAFLDYYDPNGLWGRVNPSGPLEDARGVSQDAREERVRIRVGSNTTIVGLGQHARIRGAWLDLRGSSSAQRTPRVRFGQVHVYNNYYKIINNPTYGYSWGVGIESMISAENNYFRTDRKVTPDQFISVYKGTALHESGTRVNGTPGGGFVDMVAAYNAANDPDLSYDVGWTPTLFTEILATQRVISAVESGAGPFNW